MDRQARQTEHRNGRTMLRKSIPNDATFLMKLYFRFIRLRFGMRHSILIRSLPGRKATKETLTMSFTYLLTYVCIILHYQDQTTRHKIIVIKKITSHHMLFDSITYVDVVSEISKIIQKYWQIRNSIWRVETWKKWVCNLVEDFTMNPVS